MKAITKVQLMESAIGTLRSVMLERFFHVRERPQ